MAVAAEPATRRFTVEEYHRMGEAGILGCDERLELISGQILVREPIGARHAATVDRLNRLWTSRLGDRVIVRVQNPVQFPEADSELQPDILLLQPRDDFYAGGHPRVADVQLLIEVADTSLRLDRRVKIPLYAGVGVVETWLCDLVADRLEVYRQPRQAAYGDVRTLARGERIAPRALPDVVVAVDELLLPTTR
jgi:Uma2 family endonuclease